MGRQRLPSLRETFLQEIRAEPDDDTHRLVFADWLEDNGDPDRAEFIRVQCELARTLKDAPGRPRLEAREEALLAAHAWEWTDVAFISWLGHARGKCRNPRKHGFCTTLAEGLKAHLQTVGVLDGDEDLAIQRLGVMKRRMVQRYNYEPATCCYGLWVPNLATFRRGFVEEAQVYPYVVAFFPDALVDLTVLRRLEILTGGDEEYPMPGLLEVLARLPLQSLTCHTVVSEEELAALLQIPNFAGLVNLDLWVSGYEYGDSAIEQIAATPAAMGLRSLSVSYQCFSDRAFRAVLDSPYLRGLTQLQLFAWGTNMEISTAVKRECTARFGTEW